jgi:hypothetical protein
MDIQSLFGRSKPLIVRSEEEAVRLNKEVFNLLLGCENDISELKAAIVMKNATLKAAKLADLENKFLNMRSKIDAIRNDMKNIIDLETQNRDYILFNDDMYIKDKMARLDTLSAVLEELLELTNEKPVAEELIGMVDFIYGKINILVDSVDNIISDDKHLEGTYSKLQYL